MSLRLRQSWRVRKPGQGYLPRLRAATAGRTLTCAAEAGSAAANAPAICAAPAGLSFKVFFSQATPATVGAGLKASKRSSTMVKPAYSSGASPAQRGLASTGCRAVASRRWAKRRQARDVLIGVCIAGGRLARPAPRPFAATPWPSLQRGGGGMPLLAQHTDLFAINGLTVAGARASIKRTACP